MAVALLLAIVVVLLCTRQTERDYTFALLFLLAASIALAIKIRLISILGDVFGLAVENWLPIVIVLSAVIILIVPALMIYLAIRDQFDSRCVQKSGNHREHSSASSARTSHIK